MKKYLIAVLLLFIPCVTYALTMCARDNSLVISLAQGLRGKGYEGNNKEFTWGVDFEFGKILGEATCLSEAAGGAPGTVYSYINANGEMLSYDIPAGLYNVDKDGNERGYCWCRMKHPALSRWCYTKLDTENSQWCKNNCVTYCAIRINAGQLNCYGGIGK